MSRVRYEHGFEYDLFLSYAHKDNQEPEKWVEAFEARLQKRLDEVTGKEIKIWRDARQLGPGLLLDPAVTQAVENSALLLIVLSPSWLASDWCPREHSLFQANGRQAVANRSRVIAAERYSVEKYPSGVESALASRFFVKLADGTPKHLVVNKSEIKDDLFEELFSSLAGGITNTLRELELNPIRRPGRQEGSVWFAPSANADLVQKIEALKAQVIQCGFAVTEDRGSAKIAVHLVGPGEPRQDEGFESSRPQLAYVDPAAHNDGLGQQLIRELAGRNGLEVLTDWTEFQERLAQRLKQRDSSATQPPALPKEGACVYFLHDEPDGMRASELSAHLSQAGCVVETQFARSPKERTNQNKFWMQRSHAVLLLLGKCSPDWAAIQLRHLVQYAPGGKHKSLFLDDPESIHKNILKGRPDLLVLDGMGGKDAALLIRQFLEKL